MYRVKQLVKQLVKKLLGASRKLRNYNAQVVWDLRHDKSPQQANWNMYARNSVYYLKYERFS